MPNSTPIQKVPIFPVTYTRSHGNNFDFPPLSLASKSFLSKELQLRKILTVTKYFYQTSKDSNNSQTQKLQYDSHQIHDNSYSMKNTSFMTS